MENTYWMKLPNWIPLFNSHTVAADSVNGEEFNEASEMAMEKLDSLIKVRTLKGDSEYDFLTKMNNIPCIHSQT